ncbi:MAG: hypothetical protein Q9219_006898, partial [cf. Caloplaca sp. 3 TL-2023]
MDLPKTRETPDRPNDENQRLYESYSRPSYLSASITPLTQTNVLSIRSTSNPNTVHVAPDATTSLPRKRPTSVVNLVSSSSDEEGGGETTLIIARKRRRHDQLSDCEDESSSSRTLPPSQQPQRFHRIEIPRRRRAPIIPTDAVARAARDRFLANLHALTGPPVTVVNEFDESSPSTAFNFVNQSIFGNGVTRAPVEVMLGCECKKHYGPNPGCQYLSCGCLQDSARNDRGSYVFPYGAGLRDKGCLRNFYLESRNHIYECNSHCNCDDDCKNRNVQHGRQIPLEIFKTANRGWGLRCPIPLRKGSFIDTYRGEIITTAEAISRGNSRTADEGNYFMNFDKFTEPEAIPKSTFLTDHPTHLSWHAAKVAAGDWEPYISKDGQEMYLNPAYTPYLYVCDGMHIGGPTRFMNHSCEPNCRLFTVSYNHSDPNLYDLAFFTTEEISAGEELTFDYKDEDDRSIITHEQALEVEKRDGYMPQK